ncbi:hypothetical protein [Halalkalibacter krulwichiae]|uniref:hypothetical protein n=1 Tax=Halalkalibacter krulwichiae TaxID=199441 RepID=UPI0012EDAE1B|nr:hypothetical protein [Halalkalibacter krulwichiae]
MDDVKRDINKLISTIGTTSEDYLNKKIKNWLTDPKTIKNTSKAINLHSVQIKTLRDYIELLAVQLNIPTKDDVANVAKLAIQIEEKIDLLEERLFRLTNEIDRKEPTYKFKSNALERNVDQLYSYNESNKTELDKREMRRYIYKKLLTNNDELYEILDKVVNRRK